MARRRGRGHLITSCLEHRAVLDTAAQLETEGFTVTYLTPDAAGLITPDAVAQAWREDTCLVSLMRVNNELGTLTDIDAIGRLVRARDALFHVDAAQATGKVAGQAGVRPSLFHPQGRPGPGALRAVSPDTQAAELPDHFQRTVARRIQQRQRMAAQIGG